MEVQTIYLCTTINNNSFYLLMRNIIFLYIYSKYIQNVHGFFAPTVLLTLHTRQWVYSTIGWRDFWRKKLGTCHVVVDCYGTPNRKFYFDLLLFHLAQALTRSRKITKIPKKRPKISTQNFFNNIFKCFTRIKICSLFYLKAKNEKHLVIGAVASFGVENRISQFFSILIHWDLCAVT